jgi:hypothetical protein
VTSYDPAGASSTITPLLFVVPLATGLPLCETVTVRPERTSLAHAPRTVNVQLHSQQHPGLLRLNGICYGHLSTTTHAPQGPVPTSSILPLAIDPPQFLTVTVTPVGVAAPVSGTL